MLITDTDKACDDFVQLRMRDVGTSGDSVYHLLRTRARTAPFLVERTRAKVLSWQPHIFPDALPPSSSSSGSEPGYADRRQKWEKTLNAGLGSKEALKKLHPPELQDSWLRKPASQAKSLSELVKR
jgi:hypothetical protein